MIADPSYLLSLQVLASVAATSFEHPTCWPAIRRHIGRLPNVDKQTPENVAATIYDMLGIPRTVNWKNIDGRPHEIYGGEPITALR